MTIGQRIRQALEAGPCTGQHLLAQRVLPQCYTLDQYEQFSDALRDMVTHCMVYETKTQAPGTGHEAMPWYEYTYSLNPQLKGHR